MTSSQAVAWRKLFGRVSGLFMVLIVLSLLDGMSAQIRNEFNTLQVLPGEKLPLNGPLPPKTARLEEVKVQTSSQALALTMGETHTGFWMGGEMWKGELTVAPDAPAGPQTVTVLGPEPETLPNPALTFKVVVFPTALDRRAQSASLVMKHLGQAPFVLAAWLLPCALLAGVFNFVFSCKLEAIQAREGKAEIYKLKRGPDGTVFTFGLGRDNGVRVGDTLVILDDQGRPSGQAQVQEVQAGSSVALAPEDTPARIGTLVFLEQAASTPL